ncbi:MAG TPA: DUF4177 domain-containing protein [Flavobacterium sp.]|nr:DUF4177 domain-containing protein [Flavobacterium sp.]
MKRFEYKTIVIKPTKSGWGVPKFDIAEIDKTLNELGAQGWELATMEDKNIGYGTTEDFYYTFKREI